MKKLLLTILMGLAGSAVSLMAVPAKPTPIKFTQPDGTTVMLKLTGDERGHMLLTPEGYPVARDKDGNYCFARIDADGTVTPTAVRAGLVSQLSVADRLTVDQINPAQVRKTMAARNSARTSPRAAKVVSRAGSHRGIGLMDDAFLGYKELKGLVILAEFPDQKFVTKNGNDYFTQMLNKEGFAEFGATGSARDYFVDSSNGAFLPHFEVYGPVMLPNPMEYYGGNDGYGEDKRPAEMIRDACKGLDDQINFKDYDIDGDGYVDNVFVFYAGFGEASYGDENTVWPHQWNLASARLSLTLDGVKIDKYACTNELEINYYDETVPCGIGTFVHEFSHVLGIPDLYVTNGQDGEWTPGPWSVMDAGPYNNDSRTPPSYSVFERNALGWCEPIDLFEAKTVRLEAINKSNAACLIPTLKQNEFFLIENRQQTGWDKYIPGHGMLVWHIDYDENVWYQNAVNNKKSHNYVDIEEACGSYADIYDYVNVFGGINYDEYCEALAGYAFPGTKRVTSFTDDTKPSMKTWAGVALGLPITDITEVDGVIMFHVAGGKCEAAIPEVVAPQEVGQDWFTATWNAAEGAEAYLLTVENTVDAGHVETECADFGSETVAVLPEGWEFINVKGSSVYISAGNYGVASPSLKLNLTGYGFETRKYENPVSAISFWLKGQSTDDNSYLKIEGLVGDEWSLIENVYPLKNKVSNVELTAIPAGVHKLRATYVKSAGNVGIDDFTVTTEGGGTQALTAYNSLNVGNVTTYKVTDIPADAGVISYKVRAVDTFGNISDCSESQIVTFGNSGIESVTVGADASFRVDDGKIVYQGTACARVMLLDFAGHAVATAVADNGGAAVLTAPSKGIYILAAPGLTAKVVVR